MYIYNSRFKQFCHYNAISLIARNKQKVNWKEKKSKLISIPRLYKYTIIYHNYRNYTSCVCFQFNLNVR